MKPMSDDVVRVVDDDDDDATDISELIFGI